MPKYFDGVRNLPEKSVSIGIGDLSVDLVENLFTEANILHRISIVLPSFPENSLGYVFFIERNEAGYNVKDIKGVKYFDGLTVENVIKVIKHSSGVEYDEEVFSWFYRVRNEKGIE
jgi:hypothetical protein